LSVGIVKKVPNVTRYGFVVVEDGPQEEIFFHRDDVADDGFDQLQPGQRVTFEVVPDPRNARKRQAIAVTPVAR
jgi:CspA family cold shock protein